MGDINCIIRCCKLCVHYRPEEVGDIDYGAVYADYDSCHLQYDLDEEGNDVYDFNREIERTCCVLDFWKVTEVDSELSALFDEEAKISDGCFDSTYSKFIDKYKKKKKDSFLKEVSEVYKILGMVLIPILVILSPLIPCFILDNTSWMWLLLITFPIGAALALRMWD